MLLSDLGKAQGSFVEQVESQIRIAQADPDPDDPAEEGHGLDGAAQAVLTAGLAQVQLLP